MGEPQCPENIFGEEKETKIVVGGLQIDCLDPILWGSTAAYALTLGAQKK